MNHNYVEKSNKAQTDKLSNGKSPANQVWSLNSDDMLDDDLELIDDDELLSADDLKKPDPSSLIGELGGFFCYTLPLNFDLCDLFFIFVAIRQRVIKLDRHRKQEVKICLLSLKKVEITRYLHAYPLT